MIWVDLLELSTTYSDADLILFLGNILVVVTAGNYISTSKLIICLVPQLISLVFETFNTYDSGSAGIY